MEQKQNLRITSVEAAVRSLKAGRELAKARKGKAVLLIASEPHAVSLLVSPEGLGLSVGSGYAALPKADAVSLARKIMEVAG
jgi:hypothetical protein